jgi:DNA-binding transcriptional ArsR family regulator
MVNASNQSLSRLDAEHLASVARLFGMLSEPARLQILQALEGGPMTVSELIEKTGLKQANLSRHLGLLFDAAVVTRTREGSFVRYAIAEPLVFDLCRLVCGKLHRDATRLAGTLRRAGVR